MTRSAQLLAALLMSARHPATPNSPHWVSILVPDDFIGHAEDALADELDHLFPKAPSITEADIPY